jgi:3-hydroxybutyryl-CoA dehydrogenase
VTDAVPRIAVLGTGQMGPGIALIMALGGHAVRVFGRSNASLERGRAAFEAAVTLFEAEGIVDAEQRQQATQCTTWCDDLARAVDGAGLVFESVAENLDVKQALFGEVEALTGEQTILASNTSGLPVAAIAEALQRPELVLTTHFWNPPHLVPLVEVVKGPRTAPETVKRVRSILSAAGKRPVVVNRDVPGQIGNRLQYAIIREALTMVEQGVTSIEDIDTAIKYGPGARWPVYGPMEHLDVVGLDMVAAIGDSIVPDLSREPINPQLLRQRVADGQLGVKTGRGLYDWSGRSGADVVAARDRFLLERLKASLRAAPRASQTPS